MPKEAPPRSAQMPQAPAGGAHLHWETPGHWQEFPGEGIRLARFEIGGRQGEKADAALLDLQGMMGNELEILNLWRGEIGLEPADASALSQLEKVQIGEQQALLIDLKSPEGRSILAALWPGEHGSYVFKMAGPSAVVSGEKNSVIQFLKSIDAHSGAHETAPVNATTSASNPREKRESLPPIPRGSVPAHWEEQKPGPMLLAAYGVESAGGKGTVTISMLPGEAGGLLANVNRWRGQVALPPTNAADLNREAQPLDLKLGKAMLVDLRNSSTGQGILAAHASVDGNSWFYKLTAPVAVLEKEKETFVEYLKSLDHVR